MKNYLIREKPFKRLKNTWYCLQIYKLKKLNFIYEIFDVSIEILKDWHYFNFNFLLFGDLFKFNAKWTRKRDHAGFNFEICVLGYSFLFYTYDIRHWDDENDCFEGEIETLKIVEFSKLPGLRYRKHSEYSAEEYFETVLKSKFEECLKNNSKLKIDLDKVAGYAPAFIDEIFGQLILNYGIKKVKKNVIIKSEDEKHWIEEIQNIYKKWEKKRKSISAGK